MQPPPLGVGVFVSLQTFAVIAQVEIQKFSPQTLTPVRRDTLPNVILLLQLCLCTCWSELEWTTEISHFNRV